jgi:upstream activation factor subunit UAF30
VKLEESELTIMCSDGEAPKPKRVKPEKRAHHDIGGSGKLNRFMAPNQLSEALINFLGTGESELPRTEVVKRMWNYIKGNQLQV